MKILFILVFSILSPVLSKQWVDPYDMNTSFKKNLKRSSSTSALESPGNIQNCQCNKEAVEENQSLVYLQRFVNLLLNSANIDGKDASSYHGKIHFTLDDHSFVFLKDFSESKHITLDQLRKLDTIISDVFHKTYFDGYSDMFISLQERVVTFLFSKNSLPIVGLSVFMYIAYNLFRSNFSLWYVLRYFVFIIVFVDFVQRYQQLYEEAEEHNMKVEYTSQCDTSKMNWTQWLKFMSGHHDCEKKTISLLEVGLLQVKSLIIVPLAAFGTGMGQFGAGLWQNLPFPWNILIFPLMLIFCVFLVIIVMTAVNGTPFKVNLMHLFHFEFGEKKNSITGVTLEKLLDAVSRPMIQDVKGTKKREVKVKKETSSPIRKNTSEPADKKEALSPRKGGKKVSNSSKKKNDEPNNTDEKISSNSNNSEISSENDNKALDSAAK